MTIRITHCLKKACDRDIKREREREWESESEREREIAERMGISFQTTQITNWAFRARDRILYFPLEDCSTTSDQIYAGIQTRESQIKFRERWRERERE